MEAVERAAECGLSPAQLARTYQFVEASVASGQIPGAALLVARHGIPLPAFAVGRLRPQDPNPAIRPDTIFLVASVTKPVTATAAMLLVERGQLLLDDPVCAIIPEFGAHGKERVRVRHLLTHTSGLPDMLPDNLELRRRHAPLSEFVRRICELELDFPPGTDIQYQSCGIAMLGAIVERITDTPLPEFLRREIFEPLGMNDTSLGLGHLPPERIAHVHLEPEMEGTDWGWNTPYWWNFAAPWGGMFTTVGDMFKFCQMFLNGGMLNGIRILSPATVAAMTRDQTSGNPVIPATARYRQAWGLGWGLAWRRQPASGWSYFGDLTSPGTYGHGGATGTVVWVDPVRAQICILFTTEPTAIRSGWLGRCSNLVAAAAL
ncbi:MAG: serine hydrolase [Litorilinea sp.]|nr:MAG: serine hydrolase [Litorilinea sp.]